MNLLIRDLDREELAGVGKGGHEQAEPLALAISVVADGYVLFVFEAYGVLILQILNLWRPEDVLVVVKDIHLYYYNHESSNH